MAEQRTSLTLLPVSSLEKIFPEEAPSASQGCQKGTMLLGERFSFQAAYCLEGDKIIHGCVTVSGPLAEHVILRRVGYAPSEMPNYPDHDGFVLRTQPGLYPDPLFPIQGKLTLMPGQWNSIWITVPADCPLPSGTYPLQLQILDEEGALLNECAFTLTRLAASLPAQTLLHTEWFHSDCIADWYQVPVFSGRWWTLVERYVAEAALFGVNMLLTPVFTPPLDTAVGGERTTVQLVDVSYDENGYRFGFEKLRRWIDMCGRCGITYIEFSHLFTQWGAGHAPKIMVSDRGSDPVKRFGWETDASSPEYRDFLDSFLPELMDFVHDNGLAERCFFHVSDEPHKDHLPAYLYAKELLQSHIGKLPVMDAISNYEYFEQGLVDIPVCCTDCIEPFLEHQVPRLWAYYCCAQYKEVSNRFFCMPSVRNRILGIQLYYYGIEGFLQWGFNFWNAGYSTHHLNPFANTDADKHFPSGDSFLVYPGENGPIASLRAEVLLEGLQDMRALQLLEALEGREAVRRLIEDTTDSPLTFCSYPRDSRWLLGLREECNRRIGSHCAK